MAKALGVLQESLAAKDEELARARAEADSVLAELKATAAHETALLTQQQALTVRLEAALAESSSHAESAQSSAAALKDANAGMEQLRSEMAAMAEEGVPPDTATELSEAVPEAGVLRNQQEIHAGPEPESEPDPEPESEPEPEPWQVAPGPARARRVQQSLRLPGGVTRTVDWEVGRELGKVCSRACHASVARLRSRVLISGSLRRATLRLPSSSRTCRRVRSGSER